MGNNIKKFNDFKINEEVDGNSEFDVSVNTMKNTTDVYNKYKGKINSFIKSEDLNKSSEDFNKFIENLNDEEAEASDLLRSLFNSEMLKEKIQLLEQNKKQIEEELKSRIEQLKQMQNNLP